MATDHFPVITEKSEPATGRLRISRCAFHPAGDRSPRHVKPQHGKLALNARSTPSWVLGEHSENQFPHFPADTLPACPDLMPRKPRPVEPESSAIPTHHGFWCDHNQDRFPAPHQRTAATQNHLSCTLNRGRGCRERNTASYCRRARLSRNRSRRE
jgi:hypothetical protein